MNRKTLMMASSVFTGLLGVIASFLPNEVLNSIGILPMDTLTLFVQISGALYVGFAVMNWMAKTVLIGGIYARPLAMGNFAHFIIAAIALIKAVMKKSDLEYLWLAAILYSTFAVLFGLVLFSNPSKTMDRNA
jgi:hypothetical protein